MKQSLAKFTSVRPIKSLVIIANYVPDDQYSMLYLADLFQESLSPLIPDLRILRPPVVFGRFFATLPILSKWLKYIDKYILFPPFLAFYSFFKAGDCSVYHIVDQSNSFYSFFLPSPKVLVTCCDILAFRCSLGHFPVKTGLLGKLLQFFIAAGLRNSDHIVAISESTKADLVNTLSISPNHVSTSYIPLNYPYSRISFLAALAELSTCPSSPTFSFHGGFILHVGGNEWYKNRIGACYIYRAYVEQCLTVGSSPLPLVLAGKALSPEIKSFISEHKSLSIIHITCPSRSQLNALYSLASLFLFPSIAEGFGWPILEAMSCGCPVLTSLSPPMTEVAGSSGFFLDPTDLIASSLQIIHILNMSSLQLSEWRSSLPTNLTRFDRSTFVNTYLKCYQELCNKIL